VHSRFRWEFRFYFFAPVRTCRRRQGGLLRLLGDWDAEAGAVLAGLHLLNMRALGGVRAFALQGAVGPAAEALVRLPAFLEFYRPVIQATEHLVEAVVASTGLPWWAAISIFTVSIRTANLPLLVMQYRAISPVAVAVPNYRLLGQVLQEAEAGRWQKISAAVTTARQINQKYNTKFLKAFTYIFLQVPQFITFIWAVRSLCARNESLKTGGTLWFGDLTVPDPYMILPVVSLGMTYMNLQRGITPENKDWIVNRFKGWVQMWIIISLPLSVNWPAVAAR
jgi:membrane protein insertase Oxa1/YidC/SpoIIIJ